MKLSPSFLVISTSFRAFFFLLNTVLTVVSFLNWLFVIIFDYLLNVNIDFSFCGFLEFFYIFIQLYVYPNFSIFAIVFLFLMLKYKTNNKRKLLFTELTIIFSITGFLLYLPHAIFCTFLDLSFSKIVLLFSGVFSFIVWKEIVADFDQI